MLTTNSLRPPPRVPQLTLEDERALLALYDFAFACRGGDFDDHDVAELLRDAAAPSNVSGSRPVRRRCEEIALMSAASPRRSPRAVSARQRRRDDESV